jgi:hypothetical protein
MPLVRPVQCWYCGQPLYYLGQPEYEPEVRITVETGDTQETTYWHLRCWNECSAPRMLAPEEGAGSTQGDHT